jgi:hypothetical protein
MKIQNGLVPKWMADRINPRKDKAAGDHVAASIAESGAADNGSDPRPIPAQMATAGIKVPPVSMPEKDRTLQMSSSPGGRHPSIGTNPKRVQGNQRRPDPRKKRKSRSIRNPTRARKAAFLRAFGDNGSVTRSAQLAGINRTTHYQWLSEDTRYKAEFDLRIRMAEGDALDELVRRGRVGEFQPLIHKGQFQYAVLERTLCTLADGTTAFEDKLPKGATILERRTVTTRGEMLGVYKRDPKALWKALQAFEALPPKEEERVDTAEDVKLAILARLQAYQALPPEEKDRLAKAEEAKQALRAGLERAKSEAARRKGDKGAGPADS